MMVIRPNCRASFTAADTEFLFSALGFSAAKNILSQKFVEDVDAFDALLDNEKIFSVLLEKPDCLNVSAPFYFYVLVRHVLREAGIDDRILADYVAAVLAEFAEADHVRRPMPDQLPYDYLVDLLAALHEADDHTQFTLRVHIGNLSLFLAGIFPAHLRHRARRKAAPELEYFENMGRMNYHMAGEHPLARRYNVAPVYQNLSEAFHPTRVALNQLADRLIFFGS